MKLQEAINICTEMQKWRRGEGIYAGDEPVPMPFPSETYGFALDELIEHSSRELTWQDAKRIVEIADDMLETALGRLKWEDESEEEYYTEVLKRFKEDGK